MISIGRTKTDNMDLNTKNKKLSNGALPKNYRQATQSNLNLPRGQKSFKNADFSRNFSPRGAKGVSFTNSQLELTGSYNFVNR